MLRLLPGGKPHAMLLEAKAATLPWRIVVIASVVVMAPLLEEVFFRGLLQSLLRRYFGRPWAAVLITAALFALIHAEYPHTWPALFALAVAMGYNYERCGRLYPSILIHALFNAVFVAIRLTS